MIKKFLKKLIYNLNYKPFMKETILLESNPDFMDNTRAVYDEFINRGLNDKYKFVWLVKNKNIFDDISIKNTIFINRNKGIGDRIRCVYYRLFSKYIIDCNNYIQKLNKNQYRLYLSHGSPVKNPVEYCSTLGKVDDFIIACKFLLSYNSKVWNLDEHVFSITGFPRNDYLMNENSFFKTKYDKFKKVILWMPTYRNHSSDKGGMKTGILFKYGVPCIKNLDDLLKLNEVLNQNNSVLILKLHPAENTSELESIKLSNIELFDDEILIKKHLTIYHLLSITDALITDYSSIYFDFLETGKPICLAIPDFKEYTKHCELVYDDYEHDICGFFAHNYDELYIFLSEILSGKDSLKKERLNYIKRIELFCDSNSSKRVVDLFLSKTNNKKAKN